MWWLNLFWFLYTDKHNVKRGQEEGDRHKTQKYQAQSKALNWVLPQISSGIHCLTSVSVVEHDYRSSKYQLDGRNFKEIILNSTWYTHLKHSEQYTFILQKLKKPPDRFCTFSPVPQQSS